MISKNTFVNTLTRLEALENKMEIADDALKNLSPDFGGIYIPEIFDIAIELLSEAFNDTEEWLYYFVFERDWLRAFELGDVVIDGKPIVINNWEDVYDFMIERYNIE